MARDYPVAKRACSWVDEGEHAANRTLHDIGVGVVRAVVRQVDHIGERRRDRGNAGAARHHARVHAVPLELRGDLAREPVIVFD
jgi:hypothetical protein